MFNRFYCVMLILSLLAVWSPPAAAQDCNPPHEMIVDLRYPGFGSYYVWDTVYGGKGALEHFVAGVLSNQSNVVAAGESMPNPEGKVTLLLAEFDRRGRVVWEHAHDIKSFTNVVKMMTRKGGYVILANQSESKTKGRVWVGFFNEEGKLVREKLVRDNNFSLTAHDMIESADGKGYVLAASAQRVGESSRYSILYWLDRDGNIKTDRAYMPGLDNSLLSLSALPDKSYIAAGYMATEANRRAGWVVRTDHEGNITWQRQYPRGLSARLTEVDPFIYPYIVVNGTANPSDGGRRAAWLMLLDGGSGEIGWQRFYRSDFDVTPRRLIVHKDNQMSLLLQAQNPPAPDKNQSDLERKKMEYIDILALTPRGETLLSDPYFKGEGAGAVDMFLGPNGERIFTGFADIAYNTEDPEDPEAPPVVEINRNAWVMAGVPAEPFNDPCKRPYTFFP